MIKNGLIYVFWNLFYLFYLFYKMIYYKLKNENDLRMQLPSLNKMNLSRIAHLIPSDTPEMARPTNTSGFNVGTNTIVALDEENNVYSRTEILDARLQAKNKCDEMDFVSWKGLGECWRIAHVLISDESWGSGKSHLVDMYLKWDVEGFFKRLLRSTDTTTHTITVMSFMLNNLEFVEDPLFVTILRAYIFGYSRTLWSKEEVGPENTAGLVTERERNITAIQFCCHTNVIPVAVLKTLLEADISIDTPNDSGDTPLMMAVFRSDGNFTIKAKHLINYGARIDIYNICFQNSLHIAVAGHNMDAISLILEARSERIRCASQPISLVPFDTRLQERRRLDPDPLHFPDEGHATPLVLAANIEHKTYWMRLQIMKALIDAGANGDCDINREERALDAAYFTPGKLPSFYGIITCHLKEEEDFVIYLTVQKDAFCLEVKADLNVLRFCLDEDKSILPSGDFDMEEVWLSCHHQRFDFSAEVDGNDFDIHFHVMDSSRAEIVVCGSNEGAAYKLCVRFPRGPFTSTAWAETLSEGSVYHSDLTLCKGHTLAHHAVLCPDMNTRRIIVNDIMPLCNPLRRCNDGLTATETLELVLEGTVLPWQVKQLVSRLRKNQDAMSTYILKDPKEKKKKKRPKFISPFHFLSDDVCTIILRFVGEARCL